MPRDEDREQMNDYIWGVFTCQRLGYVSLAPRIQKMRQRLGEADFAVLWDDAVATYRTALDERLADALADTVPE